MVEGQWIQVTAPAASKYPVALHHPLKILKTETRPYPKPDSKKKKLAVQVELTEVIHGQKKTHFRWIFPGNDFQRVHPPTA